MVHLRIVAPPELARQAVELLEAEASVQNIVYLEGVAKKPEGDVILCDVAREDASVILGDLRELDIPQKGSIALELIDTSISEAAREAEKAAAGLPSDAVVWEEVESRTSEQTELSVSFLVFMCLAMLIGAVGVMLDQPVLIIGAMVVGPEFGPIAGVCVAVVELRRELARRSVTALAVGFPTGIVVTILGTLLFRAIGIAPDDFGVTSQPLTGFVTKPDAFSFVVAYLAGTAGVLSLTTAKSGALIGVLISVTTIPAAAAVGVGAAYGDWDEFSGALSQLGLNLVALFLAGIGTLYVQRRVYVARRRKHRRVDPARRAAGLPTGHGVRERAKH